MPTLILTALCALCCALCASSTGEIDINGGFERCGTDQSGSILPEGWIINRGVSKRNTVSVSNEPDLVRNGRFSLYIENEQEGVTLLMKWDPLQVKAGDTLRFDCWALGRGKLSMGYVGTSPTGIFLGTFATFKEINDDETWTKLTFTYTITPQKTKDGIHENMTVVPVIYALEEAQLNVDDCTFQRIQEPTIKPAAH